MKGFWDTAYYTEMRNFWDTLHTIQKWEFSGTLYTIQKWKFSGTLCILYRNERFLGHCILYRNERFLGHSAYYTEMKGFWDTLHTIQKWGLRFFSPLLSHKLQMTAIVSFFESITLKMIFEKCHINHNKSSRSVIFFNFLSLNFSKVKISRCIMR